MSDYTTKLIDKKQIAEGTIQFFLEKPAGFEYKAGQTMDVTLINPPETDEEGTTRAFTIVVAPHEGALSFATRMRDTAFKRVFKNMAIGTEVQVAGPFGSFTLHNKHERPAVFLAGGIGITPFRSISVSAAHEKLPHKIFLFYSNRRPEDAAFLDELTSLQDQNPNFKLIATMTQMENSDQAWEGERGYINKEMLEKYLGNLQGPIYYLAGPAGMVAAMRKMLNEAGIDDDDIKTEEFSGY